MSEVIDITSDRLRRRVLKFEKRVREKLEQRTESVPFEICFEDDYTASFGRNPAEFSIEVVNEAGYRALRSLSELKVCEAYMNGDLDFHGDMRRVALMRTLLDDQSVVVTLWRVLQSFAVGKPRAQELWVHNHYDMDNLQLRFLDTAYNTYTPGIFESDDEPLEVASERKHKLCFDGLGLNAGDRVLEVGFGWGSFLRYATRRGAHVTGITLSRHQLDHVQKEYVDKEGSNAELIYANFFEFEPDETYDGIVMMGVIEELADLEAVMERMTRWIKPGGRVYLDFMAATKKFIFPAFISKYIYQGVTSRVYMPRFVEAVTQSPFELLSVCNDRRNYYLTLARWYENYEQNQQVIRREHGERTYRMFRLYLAGAANMMVHSSHLSTAYRVFLQLPHDHMAGDTR